MNYYRVESGNFGSCWIRARSVEAAVQIAKSRGMSCIKAVEATAEQYQLIFGGV